MGTHWKTILFQSYKTEYYYKKRDIFETNTTTKTSAFTSTDQRKNQQRQCASRDPNWAIHYSPMCQSVILWRTHRTPPTQIKSIPVSKSKICVPPLNVAR